MTVTLAVLSALAFGVGMSLQQRRARTISFEHAMRVSMMGRLMLERTWLAGIVLTAVGFLLQLIALRSGSLSTVAPIVTSAIVVCLAVTSWHDHDPLGSHTWVGIGLVVIGIAVFVMAGGDGSATTTVSGPPFLAVSVGLAALVGLCVGRARSKAGTVRTVAIGVAAGLGNAYVALLARAGAESLRHGVGAVLSTPYPYALVVAAVVAVGLDQAIYQVDRPTLSLPLATTTEAAGSVLLAVAVLHEHPVLAGARGGIALLGLVGALLGLAGLSRDGAVAIPTADVSDPTTIEVTS